MGAASVCDWVGHGGIVGRDSGWQFVAMNIDFIKGEEWGTELQFLVCQLCATEAMTWKRYDLSKPGCKAVAGHHGVSVEVHIDFSSDYTA